MTTSTLKAPQPAARPRRKPLRLVLIAVGVALGMAGWIWVIADHVGSGPHHDVKVLDTFTGKIDSLNGDHTAGCVQGSKRVCSGFVSAHELQVGQTVHVAHEVYLDRAGHGYDMLVVIPPAP